MLDPESPSSPYPAAKPITLIPVGLKEAALDSPSFRSGFAHFTEQLEAVEKWLSGYYRSVSKLSHETAPFEAALDAYLTQLLPPLHVSEAILDHDYTLLAVKRYGDCAKEFWTAAFSGLRRIETHVVEPIKTFINNDLSPFRESKKNVEATQKQMDGLQSRYAAQAKFKEPSSLREDAFQLHEARKAYLRAAMDFSVAAPQLRINLDKLLVRIFSDQWHDLRDPRLNIQNLIARWGADIDRVRGWSREMENGERAFRQELDNARRQIEENAEIAIRPSREIEDYAPDSRQRGPSGTAAQPHGGAKVGRPEKQGWLMLRTVVGKPSRTIWVRRWFYVKNGIFGWLIQGSRTNAVEESDRIGVLLCSVRPSGSDDRRHVFEVKTKDRTLLVQAESENELRNWIATFEIAKQKALDKPASTEASTGSTSQDLAFAISPPSAPEFAAIVGDSGTGQSNEDQLTAPGPDRSATLPIPVTETATRSSYDAHSSRRPSALDGAGDNPRDPASRIMSKLDLHKRSVGGLGIGASSNSNPAGGGIASLIAASHGSMPVGPGALPAPPTPDVSSRKIPTPLSTLREMPQSSLAPSTLANPPAPTNLSSTAVIVNGDRGVGPSRPDSSGGVPSGLLANVWGSSNWGFLNRLERGEIDEDRVSLARGGVSEVRNRKEGVRSEQTNPTDPSSVTDASGSSHRKTVSLDGEVVAHAPNPSSNLLDYPNYYPAQLKMQDAQFRLLFPDVPSNERVVYVFKATWNPNEQQEFPGRVYVTGTQIYFYSNHYGMTMTTSIHLMSMLEVTGASGRDWDVVFLHLKEDASISGFTRITIKTFLEPVKLLQHRLSYLAKNASSESPAAIEEIMKTLIAMEADDFNDSPSDKGWEKVPIDTPADGSLAARRLASSNGHRDLRANVLVDQGLYDITQAQAPVKSSKTFKLPKHPVVFVPSGMDQLVVEKDFDISPKALFHVLFGDRSAVWQLLYHERQAQRIRQGPWNHPAQGHVRRDFEYDIQYLGLLGRVRTAEVTDSQIIDTATEHLLYCVSDRKTPWHLPYRKDFSLLSKIVITHVGKGRCKIAIFVKIDWSRPAPSFARAMVSKAALRDMEVDALDLVDVLSDQVRRLIGVHGRTKKAIQIFGLIGQQSQVSEFATSDTPDDTRLRRARKPLSLSSLILRDLASLMETIATMLLQFTGDCIRYFWKTISANTIILVLLFASVGLNLLFSAQGTTEWWRERQVTSLMTRLGIGPSRAMERAIYLQDLGEATSAYDLSQSTRPSSECRDTFENLVSPSETATGVQTSISPSDPQAAVSLRLQRKRQHLGERRHDLVVAMRVVNSVEREMVRAEWESWLQKEGARCHQLRVLIQTNSTEARADGWGRLAEHRDAVVDWYENYCGSCRKELERVTEL